MERRCGLKFVLPNTSCEGEVVVVNNSNFQGFVCEAHKKLIESVQPVDVDEIELDNQDKTNE